MPNRKRRTVFYLDRFTLNSVLEPHELESRLPVKQLKKLCHGRCQIKEASNSGKHHGYRSKIETYQVTDGFIKSLSQFDIGKCEIWHIEIAGDYEFSSMKEAGRYLLWFYKNVYRNWSNKGRFYQGPDNNSVYLGNQGPDDNVYPDAENDYVYAGKRDGKLSDNYVRAYPMEVDKKILDVPAFHLEFVLEESNNVNKVLGISHYSGLGTAEELFKAMVKRYLRFPEINRKKLKQFFWHVYNDGVKARFYAESVENIRHLQKIIDFHQELVLKRQYIRKFQRKMNVTGIRNTTKSEKFILESKVSDFLRKNIGKYKLIFM